MTRHGKSIFALIFVSFLLASCGSSGGGGGSANENNPTVSILRKLNDNDDYGIARRRFLTEGKDTAVHNYIVPNPDNYVNFVRERGDDDTNDSTDYTGMILNQTLKYGYVQKGVIRTSSGRPIDAVRYLDRDGDGKIGAIHYGSDIITLLDAGGHSPTNIPSGTHKYNGFIGMSPTYRFNSSLFEHGSFKMRVDFGRGSGQIEGDDNSSLKLDGRLVVDTINGSFSGNDIELTRALRSYPAYLYGNFHGNLAVGVTGVFHTTVEEFASSAVDYSGMLVGWRTDQRNQ